MLRELREEVGTDNAEILGHHPEWLSYDLPPHLLGRALGGRYRGQRQLWFALRYLGGDDEIRLDLDPHPEFDAWRWLPLDALPTLEVGFKRSTYAILATAFAPYAAAATRIAPRMLRLAWSLARQTVAGYIEDDALSRGAAIAYYTVFAIAPVLVIVISIAGLVYGQEAARGAIVGQLQDMMGHDAAEAIQAMIASAGNRRSGTLGAILGFGALLLTASGVFGEMQTGLNRIWKAEPKTSTVSRLVRARAASLGLVAALGFLLMVSLAVSAAITAFSDMLRHVLPDIDLLLRVINFLISLGLISALFAAIYKILPDVPTTWADVGVGAVVTAFLFTLGKTVIGLYIGSSQVASSYGAAGALVIVLLWVYYSAQIFLLGAEFTRAWAAHHGSAAAAGV